jgi:hypothetical protein
LFRGSTVGDRSGPAAAFEPDPAMRNRPSSGGGLAIEAGRLEKRFGGRQVLAGIDLAVGPGTVYGLLGPTVRASPQVADYCREPGCGVAGCLGVAALDLGEGAGHPAPHEPARVATLLGQGQALPDMGIGLVKAAQGRR